MACIQGTVQVNGNFLNLPALGHKVVRRFEGHQRLHLAATGTADLAEVRSADEVRSSLVWWTSKKIP
jgi:hypothetical protein